MKSFYSFHEIIEDVKSDIGFSNMRNLYPEIRQMIARAEEEINPYGGYLVRKRMKFYKGNGNFDGKNIKKPADFVSLDKNQMCADGLCGASIIETPSHITLCKPCGREHVFFTYWALNCDGEGNPIIARNHKEAVVNFIVFKMYGAKVFNGDGSASQRREYRIEWEDSCMAARGYDAMPTDKGMQAVYQMGKMSRKEREAKFCEDLCTSNNCVETYDDSVGDIYVFQLNGHSKDISGPEEITDAFLENADKYSKNQVKAGISHSFPYLGRYGFVFENTTSINIKLTDILDVELLSAMNIHYDFEKSRIIFVSKEFITPSTIFFKVDYE